MTNVTVILEDYVSSSYEVAQTVKFEVPAVELRDRLFQRGSAYPPPHPNVQEVAERVELLQQALRSDEAECVLTDDRWSRLLFTLLGMVADGLGSVYCRTCQTSYPSRAIKRTDWWDPGSDEGFGRGGWLFTCPERHETFRTSHRMS